MKSFIDIQNCIWDHYVSRYDHKRELEHLYHRHWIRQLCIFCKVLWIDVPLISSDFLLGNPIDLLLLLQK